MTVPINNPATTPSNNASASLAPVLDHAAPALNTFPFPSQKRSRAHTQRWVEKTGSSITKSETPQYSSVFTHIPFETDFTANPYPTS